MSNGSLKSYLRKEEARNHINFTLMLSYLTQIWYANQGQYIFISISLSKSELVLDRMYSAIELGKIDQIVPIKLIFL